MYIIRIAGKAGLQFYTQIKTVAQQWKDLPTLAVPPSMPVMGRGMSSALTSTSERESPSQRVSLAMHSSSERDSPTSDSDVPNPGMSSMSPTTDTDLPSHGMSLVIPGTSERDLSIGDMSLAMPPSTERDLPGQGESITSPQMSERLYMPQTSRWNETPQPTSQRTETITSSSGRILVPTASLRNGLAAGLASQRSDSAMSLTSERVYMPNSHDNMGPVSHRNDRMAATSHHMDTAVHPSSERVYILTTSHLNDSMNQPFQRSDNIFTASERLYMPQTSQRATDIGLHSTSERMYISAAAASQRNENLAGAASASQQTDPMSASSERMYMSPMVQRNANAAAMGSASERLYISAGTAQRMYSQNPIISMDEFPNQGASLSLPTSQRI